MEEQQHGRAAGRRGGPPAFVKAMMGRRGGRGRGRDPGTRPVDEAKELELKQRLEDFRASSETELVFEADLSNHDRALLHKECRKHGLSSKSRGKGANRALSVFKPQPSLPKFVEHAYELPVEPESLSALSSHCATFPPDSSELSSASTLWRPEGPSSGASERRKRHKTLDVGRSSLLSQPDALAAYHATRSLAPKHLSEQTRALPVAQHHTEIVTTVENHQVTIVAGETGCGKTTQVPQYILDHWLGSGRGAYCLCTQPRRISAMSIADRVASERGESVGHAVGYQIRLEAKCCPDTAMLFCTNGILLRKLTQAEGSTKELDRVTHVIVDEVHERDMFADFLLVVLKELLQTRPDLKVILMSATMNESLFSDYFNGAPIIRIPGQVHPVTNVHLDDILPAVDWRSSQSKQEKLAERGMSTSVAQSSERPPQPADDSQTQAMEEAISNAFLSPSDANFSQLLALAPAASPRGEALVNVQHRDTGACALMAAAGQGREDDVQRLLDMGADVSLRSLDGSSAADWAERFNFFALSEKLKREESTQSENVDPARAAEILGEYQQTVDPDEVDLDLALKVIEHIHASEGSTTADGSAGAILVFLPGWDEITKLRDMLREHRTLGHKGEAHIYPLHSMVAPSEQRRVFSRPPQGVRKVVLATNIAETAVTIDDVVYVVDSGRLKEKSFDPYTGVSTLQTTWVSKAGAQQRRGRAGRCQPGKVFRLFSKARHEAMADFQLPELKRSPLEELCLQVKLLEGVPGLMGDEGGVADFLAKAIEPPIETAVESAMQLLQTIGALAEGEKLTTLGRHLANLPLHPRIGKMMLFASMLSTTKPNLTAACAASYRSPFVMPLDPEQKKRAEAAKRSFSDEYGGSSDHLATTAAFERWDDAKRFGNERRFLDEHQLTGATLSMIAGMRSQLEGALMDRGVLRDHRNANMNARDPALVRAALAVGFYPQVGIVKPLKKEPRAPKPATIATSRGDKVALAGTSVNTLIRGDTWQKEQRAGYKYNPVPSLIVYDELTRNETQLTIREATAVEPFSLLLVASELSVEEDAENDSDDHALVCMDGWIRFRMPVRAISGICLLRRRLANAFVSHVERPGTELDAVSKDALNTAKILLRAEGKASANQPLDEKQVGPSTESGRGKKSYYRGAGGGHIAETGGRWHSDEPHWRGGGRKSTPGRNSTDAQTLKEGASAERMPPRHAAEADGPSTDGDAGDVHEQAPPWRSRWRGRGPPPDNRGRGRRPRPSADGGSKGRRGGGRRGRGGRGRDDEPDL